MAKRQKKNMVSLCILKTDLCPFDLDAIDPKQMTEVEKKRLNDYHANVYKVVSPYLQGEELAWLKEATRAI